MKRNFIILLVFLLSGCGAPVTNIKSTSPQDYPAFEQTIFNFNQGKQNTWDDLLSQFANSDFNINKLNMSGYQVKVSMTGDPEAYLDCGTKIVNTDDNVVTLVNARKNYSYHAYQRNHLETYSIKNTFTGHANLIVTGNETSSRIIVQYNLELHTDEKKTTTRGVRYNTNETENLQFGLAKSMHSDLLNTTCRSKGNLEQHVLDILKMVPHFIVSPTT